MGDLYFGLKEPEVAMAKPYTMRQVVAACKALEVEPDASGEEIRKSFRRLSLEYHPDKNADCREEAAARFNLITKARDILAARAEWQEREQAEREEYEAAEAESARSPGHSPRIPSGGRDSAMELPTAGEASKGWGPCPACGGVKRHVGGRVCPIYGRWFDAERRLRQGQEAPRGTAVTVEPSSADNHGPAARATAPTPALVPTSSCAAADGPPVRLSAREPTPRASGGSGEHDAVVDGSASSSNRGSRRGSSFSLWAWFQSPRPQVNVD